MLNGRWRPLAFDAPLYLLRQHKLPEQPPALELIASTHRPSYSTCLSGVARGRLRYGVIIAESARRPNRERNGTSAPAHAAADHVGAGTHRLRYAPAR